MTLTSRQFKAFFFISLSLCIGRDVAHLSYETEQYGRDMEHDIEKETHHVEDISDNIENSSMVLLSKILSINNSNTFKVCLLK